MFSKTALATLLLLASSAVSAPVERRTPVQIVTEWVSKTVYVNEYNEPLATTIHETASVARAAPTYVPEPAPAPAPEPVAVVELAPPAPPAPAEEERAPVQEEAPAAPAPAPEVKKGTSYGGSKRGIAYNTGDKASLKFNSGKISWAYNWGAKQGHDDLPGNIQEYVPMCWGTPKTASDCENISPDAKHILAFNEPDHPDQAAMSVGQAISDYKRYMNPKAANGARLGSPAVTSDVAPGKGLNWLKPFLEGCSQQGCKIDFIAAHWYSGRSEPDAFISHIKETKKVAAAAGYDVPIWVTEFGVHADEGQQAEFLREVVPWLDSTDYVERYSYFSALTGSSGEMRMVTGDALNRIGETYVSL